MNRPDPTEYAPFYAGYIAQLPEGDILEILDAQTADTLRLIFGISEEQAEFRYAPGKWSVREVIGHMTDTERIFGYRALRFARGDTTPVPGFDENLYVANADFDRRTLAEIGEEFGALRTANLHLLRSLGEAAWLRRGAANNAEVTVRAIAHIMAGHERHHTRVLRERYLGAGSNDV